MNRPTLLYIIGAPGVGKSTVMKHITLRLGTSVTQLLHPFAHRLLQANDGAVNAIELGAKRENFSGTDALSMSVLPKAVEWIAARPCSVVLGEGDRLAVAKFFEAAKEAGYKLQVVSLEASPRVLAARRHSRSWRLGEHQDERWVKGRETKSARLADEYATLRVDSAAPPHQLAALIMEATGLS